LKENHKDGYISAQEREARRRRAEEGRISRERLEQYYATGDLRIDPDRALAFMDDYRMKAQKDNPKRLIGVVSGNQLLNICDSMPNVSLHAVPTITHSTQNTV